MKLFKFRKTNSIAKIVLIILFTLSFAGASIAQEKDPKTTTPTGTPQTTVPANTKNNSATTKNNRTTTSEGRVPTATPTDTRELILTPAETATIEAEEKARLKREADLAADEAKAEIVKRTFGSSLFTKENLDFTPAVNIATPNNYVLGAGDKLSINIYGYSQNQQLVTVNPDGFIVLEKSGLVNIAGLSIDDAETKIKNALSKTYPRIKGGAGFPADTFVKVSLTGFRSIKVKVAGQVILPGTFTVSSFSTVMNALYACGGPNEIGTYRNIKVIRGNRVVATFDIYEYLINGFTKGDLLLKDQDVIHVGPFESRVAVNGEMKINGLFEVLPNDKVSNLIKYAGGFSQYAYSDLIKIYRNTSSERRIINISKANFANEQVQTGDSLVVERVLDRFENMVTIEGAVFRPGEYSLDNNTTLTQLIKSAAGLKEESLEGRINILRTNDDLSISNLSKNLFNIEKGLDTDLQLKRLDRVIVPSMFDLTEKAFIRIEGAVNNPDAKEGIELPYVKNMTIKDVIVRVGGLTEAASLSRIEIVRRKRNIDPKASDAQIADIIQFNMRPDLTLLEGDESLILLPFDEIIVRNSPNYEKQNYITITGEVLFPGKYGIEYKDQTIAKAIQNAGGLTDLAYKKGAILLRRTLLSERQRIKREQTLNNLNINKNVKTTTDIDALPAPTTTTTEGEVADSYLDDDVAIDLEQILNNMGNPAYDIILQNGDEIVIPKRLETVRIEGEILYPNTVKFNSSKSFLDYISEAGGFTRKSAKGSAYVRYPNGSVDRTRKFMFVRFHPKIEPGSEIVIPGKSETTADQFNKFSGLVTTVSGILGTIVTIFGLIRLSK